MANALLHFDGSLAKELKRAGLDMTPSAFIQLREFDHQVKFTITTTQTKEDKARGYIFLQTQKNPNRTYSANTRAGRWNFPSPNLMELRIIRLKLSTGEYETLATSIPASVTASQI